MKQYKFKLFGEFNASPKGDPQEIASKLQSEIFRIARKESGGIVAFNGVKVEYEEI
jgi:hypothetical protein